jgi:phenylacetic acid degradation protein PaaD
VSTRPDTQGVHDVHAMWAADAASRALGMELVECDEGRAAVRMTVRNDMLNGHGTAHGGLVAALADSAFAVACNSHGFDAVAAGFDVTFLRPARAGDVLTATAVERVREGRTGLCDVTVATADGAVVAEFRGRSRALPARR